MTQTSTTPTNDFDPIITRRSPTVVSIAFPGHLPHLWTVEELRCAIRAAARGNLESATGREYWKTRLRAYKAALAMLVPATGEA